MSAIRITIGSLLFTAVVTTSVSAQSFKKAPVLDLKDLQGRQIKLSDYRGKVVLINFWATWCVPCRTEIPDLVKMQRQYNRQGLRLIGITYPPQKIAEVRRFVKRMRVNYRIALGTESIKALFDESDVLPITVIIDRDGNFRDVIKGVLYRDEFEEKIKPQLSPY
jgi:thiol-disulfide isomerase/thioredoxin